MKIRAALLITILLAASSNAADRQWRHEDLSFDFSSSANLGRPGILRDEWIQIAPFEAPGFEGRTITTPAFRVIFGEGSESLFDALGIDEVAGLKRADARRHVENLRNKGMTEAEDAFVAGLTNVHQGRVFMFFNVTRLRSSPGYATRVLAHEPLHLARMLISKGLNPGLDFYKDPYRRLDDRTEELFAETLERGTTISLDRYARLSRSPSR